MDSSDQSTAELEQMLQRCRNQLTLLNQQGRLFNTGARRFMDQRIDRLTDLLASTEIARAATALTKHR